MLRNQKFATTFVYHLSLQNLKNWGEQRLVHWLHLHIGIEYTMFVRKFLGKQFYETFFCFLIWGYYSTVPQFWKKWLDWVRLATEHSGMFKRTWSELKGNMSELWCSVANPSLKVPDFQFLCMVVHVHCNCPFVWPYSCSFAFAFYSIASPRHERIDRERRVARMRPKKRELLYMNCHTVHRNGKIRDYILDSPQANPFSRN